MASGSKKKLPDLTMRPALGPVFLCLDDGFPVFMKSSVPQPLGKAPSAVKYDSMAKSE